MPKNLTKVFLQALNNEIIVQAILYKAHFWNSFSTPLFRIASSCVRPFRPQPALHVRALADRFRCQHRPQAHPATIFKLWSGAPES